jgi:hypothetical protein
MLQALDTAETIKCFHAWDYPVIKQRNFFNGLLYEQNVSDLHFRTAAIAVRDTKPKTDHRAKRDRCSCFSNSTIDRTVMAQTSGWRFADM